MTTVRIIYASQFSPGTGSHEIDDILKQSRANNPAKNISGILCYAPGVFLQCLEGPRKEVNKLYRVIAGDARHRDLTLLEYSDIRERTFGEWSMAYVRTEDLGDMSDLVPHAREKFSPFDMTAGEAYDFVAAIARKRRDLLERTLRDMREEG